jgi:hypothetical protein
MPNIYAKIQGGVVVNMQMMLTTDVFDPAYTWVMVTVTNYVASPTCTDGSPVQTGSTYDGTNFTAATGS